MTAERLLDIVVKGLSINEPSKTKSGSVDYHGQSVHASSVAYRVEFSRPRYLRRTTLVENILQSVRTLSFPFTGYLNPPEDHCSGTVSISRILGDLCWFIGRGVLGEVSGGRPAVADMKITRSLSSGEQHILQVVGASAQVSASAKLQLALVRWAESDTSDIQQAAEQLSEGVAMGGVLANLYVLWPGVSIGIMFVGGLSAIQLSGLFI